MFAGVGMVRLLKYVAGAPPNNTLDRAPFVQGSVQQM